MLCIVALARRPTPHCIAIVHLALHSNVSTCFHLTLALSALHNMVDACQQTGDVEVDVAVAAAQCSNDGAVRAAALRLVTLLAGRAPSDTLAHVLQVGWCFLIHAYSACQARWLLCCGPCRSLDVCIPVGKRVMERVHHCTQLHNTAAHPA